LEGHCFPSLSGPPYWFNGSLFRKTKKLKCVQQVVAFVGYNGNAINKPLHSNGRLPNITLFFFFRFPNLFAICRNTFSKWFVGKRGRVENSRGRFPQGSCQLTI
jgi:hypothetical protein